MSIRRNNARSSYEAAECGHPHSRSYQNQTAMQMMVQPYETGTGFALTHNGAIGFSHDVEAKMAQMKLSAQVESSGGNHNSNAQKSSDEGGQCNDSVPKSNREAFERMHITCESIVDDGISYGAEMYNQHDDSDESLADEDIHHIRMGACAMHGFDDENDDVDDGSDYELDEGALHTGAGLSGDFYDDDDALVMTTGAKGPSSSVSPWKTATNLLKRPGLAKQLKVQRGLLYRHISEKRIIETYHQWLAVNQRKADRQCNIFNALRNAQHIKADSGSPFDASKAALRSCVDGIMSVWREFVSGCSNAIWSKTFLSPRPINLWNLKKSSKESAEKGSVLVLSDSEKHMLSMICKEYDKAVTLVMSMENDRFMKGSLDKYMAPLYRDLSKPKTLQLVRGHKPQWIKRPDYPKGRAAHNKQGVSGAHHAGQHGDMSGVGVASATEHAEVSKGAAGKQKVPYVNTNAGGAPISSTPRYGNTMITGSSYANASENEGQMEFCTCAEPIPVSPHEVCTCAEPIPVSPHEICTCAEPIPVPMDSIDSQGLQTGARFSRRVDKLLQKNRGRGRARGRKHTPDGIVKVHVHTNAHAQDQRPRSRSKSRNGAQEGQRKRSRSRQGGNKGNREPKTNTGKQNKPAKHGGNVKTEGLETPALAPFPGFVYPMMAPAYNMMPYAPYQYMMPARQ